MNDTVSLACYNNTVNLIRSVHRTDVTNVYEEYAKIADRIESSLGGNRRTTRKGYQKTLR